MKYAATYRGENSERVEQARFSSRGDAEMVVTVMASDPTHYPEPRVDEVAD